MESERSLAPAVTRAAAILDVLAEQRGQAVGLAELARRLGAAKSSVSNICNALVDSGLLRRTPEGFGLGRRLVGYAEAYLAGVDIVREFQDVCRSRGASVDETVQLAVLSEAGLEVVYLARRDGRRPVVLASQIGRPLPATTTATGKAMLAELSAPELAARLEGAAPLPRLTQRSITDAGELRRDLAAVRDRGYALDEGETVEGLLCLAATVPGTASRGQAAAVSFTGLAAGFSARRQEERAAELRALARELGARMGAPDAG
ncbi:DNA-binding IclR family transcriptional regulator [Spinactinospora alkalitolerans]|uniref:DNA-binding IclR family transcriptional regulator n=1 Tax=Spinactinospora alkalitolerans TaxID=687207 RepID=A0A852TUQ9_9ACTN|nr:IclR family transcriptional regulator [Spinactinospora alkalitolerans]NYE47769.1 DNA-binding IclR family transcriptional regulator [Spinactinospora alkalitolerans]